MIAKIYVDQYQDVQAKQAILSLQDISNIDISVNIPEHVIIQGKRIEDVETFRGKAFKDALRFDALPNKTFTVAIKEFSTQADPATQTYNVILTMPAPKDRTSLSRVEPSAAAGMSAVI